VGGRAIIGVGIIETSFFSSRLRGEGGMLLEKQRKGFR